jgi:hypothetical protein
MIGRTGTAATIVLVLTIAACDGDTRARASSLALDESSTPELQGDADSTIAAGLVHFRTDLIEPRGFEGAATTLDGLIERFIRALETADTAAFAPMMITRSEYAWLYYPYTRYTKAPYTMDPEVLWMLLVQNSEKGITRALREYGARPLGYAGYQCSTEPAEVGANRLWDGCRVTLGIESGAAGVRLFGVILERDGRFKFLSYSNDL